MNIVFILSHEISKPFAVIPESLKCIEINNKDDRTSKIVKLGITVENLKSISNFFLNCIRALKFYNLQKLWTWRPRTYGCSSLIFCFKCECSVRYWENLKIRFCDNIDVLRIRRLVSVHWFSVEENILSFTLIYIRIEQSNSRVHC